METVIISFISFMITYFLVKKLFLNQMTTKRKKVQ